MAGTMRAGAERMETLEKHLRFHPGREVASAANVTPPAAPSPVEKVRGGLTSLVPLSAAQMKWAPAVFAVLACVAAWRNRAQTKDKLINLILKGGMWVLQSRLAGSPIEPAVGRFLQEAEASTYSKMAELGDLIQQLLPLEESLRKLKDKSLGLTKEMKLALWFDVEVYALSRIVVGAFTLSVAHFVSSTVHALCPSDMSGDVFLPASEVYDLPLHMDLPLIIKRASTTCREALRKRGIHKPDSKAEFDDIRGVLQEMKDGLLECFGLSSASPSAPHANGCAAPTTSLHEFVLGEEAAAANANGTPITEPSPPPHSGCSEPDLLKKLRDLLEAAAPRSLLTKTIDSFVTIACQHVTSMLQIDNTKRPAGDKISVVHLIPRLSTELRKFTEDDNEYLLSLRHGSEESVESQWAAFFLDLNALEAPAQPAFSDGARNGTADASLLDPTGDELAQLASLLTSQGMGVDGDGDGDELSTVQAMLANAEVGAMPERLPDLPPPPSSFTSIDKPPVHSNGTASPSELLQNGHNEPKRPLAPEAHHPTPVYNTTDNGAA